MFSTTAEARTRRSRWSALVGLAVIAAAAIATVADQAGPSPAPTIGQQRRGAGAAPPTEAVASGDAAPDADGAVTAEDGVLPDGATAFDDQHPGVANLDPALLQALRAATAEAAATGVRLVVNSGWRSPEYQEQLFREAVAEHGSIEAAARWVAGADSSLHVSGDAVDIGGADARAWLAEHGAAHGLCQIYVNESWHYELRPDAAVSGCPAMYADTTQDPRTGRDHRVLPAPPQPR